MPKTGVYLSFGRHGRYGRDTAIERQSMLEAFLSGQQLFKSLPTTESVYFSPIARAAQTAKFRALGLNCPNLIETDFLLENASAFSTRCFIEHLVSTAMGKEDTLKHYHFVTHLPVIEKLGLSCLGAGEICICQAANWQDMLCSNFTTTIITNPPADEIAVLQHKMNVSPAELENLSADKIFSLCRQAI